jgi:putative Holliday junction resolvase
MRNLGLDIGDKRIGVAISDSEQILASLLTTIVRYQDDKTIDAILEITEKYEIQKIIVGFPYSLDGTINKQAEKVKTFVETLSTRTKINIEFRDERLSTVAVNRMFSEAGLKRSKRKEQRDAAAAAFILQGYLDSLKTYTDDKVY